MGIFAKTIFSLFYLVVSFNDFYPRKASVCQARLHNWYLLLCFRSENIAWKFLETRLKSDQKATRWCQSCHNLVFEIVGFRDFNDFKSRKASVCDTFLSQRERRSKSWKAFFMLPTPLLSAFFSRFQRFSRPQHLCSQNKPF